MLVSLQRQKAYEANKLQALMLRGDRRQIRNTRKLFEVMHSHEKLHVQKELSTFMNSVLGEK